VVRGSARAAGPPFFAYGASRCGAMGFVLRRVDRPRRSKQLLGWLPPKESSAPDFVFTNGKSRTREALETGCRSIEISTDVGSFGSPELGA
jgi:hypothetical protein